MGPPGSEVETCKGSFIRFSDTNHNRNLTAPDRDSFEDFINTHLSAANSHIFIFSIRVALYGFHYMLIDSPYWPSLALFHCSH